MLIMKEVKIISNFWNISYDYKLANKMDCLQQQKIVISQLTTHFVSYFMQTYFITTARVRSPECDAAGADLSSQVVRGLPRRHVPFTFLSSHY